MNDFNELPWHDTPLMNIYIDRSAPGERDEVRLALEWPDSTAGAILFKDVYAVRCELNFGVIADETILTASQLSDTAELTRIRERWRPSAVALEGLKCFEFETASTRQPTADLCAQV